MTSDLQAACAMLYTDAAIVYQNFSIYFVTLELTLLAFFIFALKSKGNADLRKSDQKKYNWVT